MQLTDNTDYIKKAMLLEEQKKMQAAQNADIGGIPPMMQNIAQQQANQNAAMAEGAQLAKASGTPTPSSQPNLALAGALRKDKKKEEELANREASQWNQRPAIEYYSKGLNPMDIISDQ